MIITATVLATTAGVAAAQEAVPQVRRQAPGYDRMMLGDFEITTVCDGTVAQAFDRLMTNAKTEEVRALVAGNHATLPFEVSIKTFDGQDELFPGIRTRPVPGHTPGHTLSIVESKGQKLVLVGDTVHAAEVQFSRPSITILYDVDAESAAARRKAIFADAAEKGYWVGAAHISFPGLGHLRVDCEGYAWVPAPYRLTD